MEGKTSLYSISVVVFNCFIVSECFGLNRWTPVIYTQQGRLRGVRENDQYKYLGIPYATVGTRFQPPEDAPSWEDVLDANREGNRCVQVLAKLNIPVGSEDCLRLNVYTPTDAIKKSLPVMVFIHGGGFYWGSSTSLIYDPAPLVKKGVIVVTFNYRLGALGFLCLGVKGAPGNVGLRDQTAALMWIQKNIMYFGGNPNLVTLFGQSAGSASVHYHVLSSSGLFHRAILESGTVMSPFAFSYDPINKASMVARNLGYNTKDPKELLSIFRNTSAYDIAMASKTKKVLGNYIFTPCVENPLLGNKAIITENPYEMVTSEQRLDIPMMVGYNNEEGIYYAGQYDKTSLENLNDHFEDILPNYLRFSSLSEKNKVAVGVKYFYFQNRRINSNSIRSLINFFSDTYIHFPSIISSENRLRRTNSSLYNYYFQFDSLRNLGKYISGLPGVAGAAHTDELYYIFQPSFLLFTPFLRERVLIEHITSLWTDFAKTGNPTAVISQQIIGLWNSSKADSLLFCTIDDHIKTQSLPNKQRIDFWRQLYEQYGIKPK